MPELFGASYSQAELSRRIGRLEQVAGVRLVTLGDGQARGVRVLEFRTGTRFAFDVLVDRSFDVGRCELGGRPLSWLSGAGVVGPWYYEPDDWDWFRAWGGGMVVTCGLDHTLVPGEDTAEHFNQPHIRTTVPYGLHGRASAACQHAWSATANDGTAMSVCCGQKGKYCSRRSSASSSCSAAASRPASAAFASRSATR
jgi:DNA-binding transcriptional LysR family regulator